MNFATFQFIIFLGLSLTVFFLISAYYRKYFILICSYLFYGTWSVPLISIILFSTSVDYYLGNRIHNTTSKQLKKLFLTLSIFINCSILIYFKYANFFGQRKHARCSYWHRFTNTQSGSYHPALRRFILYFRSDQLHCRYLQGRKTRKQLVKL